MHFQMDRSSLEATAKYFKASAAYRTRYRIPESVRPKGCANSILEIPKTERNSRYRFWWGRRRRWYFKKLIDSN